MKKIFLRFLIITVVFSGCSTDFDVNTDWKENIVVFGLLDPSLDNPFGVDTQYIKINKVFLGENDAFVMAQNSDSINLDPNYLEVKLHKVYFGDTITSILLDTTVLYKDPFNTSGDLGLFSIDNNIIYRAVVPSGFFSENRNYVLTIKNLDSGIELFSTTEVINDFSFRDFNPSYKIGFYNPSASSVDSLKFTSKTIKWNTSNNGSIYQLDLVFNYIEDDVLKSLVWSQREVEYDGINMQTRIEGKSFFNFLTQNLTSNNEIERNFVSVDLVMTVGTEDLNTYIKINQPINTISQQRPQFTNIENGLGIFSSRYTHVERNIGLTQNTLDYLLNGLDLNFQ